MAKRRACLLMVFLAVSCLVPSAARSGGDTIYVALNAEIGHLTSTSDDAIRQGILIAIDEINRAGGVLGGKRMALLLRDNRSIPARAIAHNRELAANPDVVAVFCGKFSSAILESLPFLHEVGLPLLDPWAANDKVIENGFNPNFAFRLSLKDSWAVPAMIEYARRRKLDRIGLLLVNTSWGRNNNDVIIRHVGANPGVTIVGTQWFNYGEKSLMEHYRSLRKAGAKAIVLVCVEPEGALLVREMAALPKAERMPVISHWSVTGGDFPALCGKALDVVDLAFVQTFDLHTNKSQRAQRVLAVARRLFGIESFADVKSPVGLAHAYDLTHILALAIGKAGSADRKKIRDALEDVAEYDGLIRHYKPPFSAANHEALGPEYVFMARYGKNGLIRRID